MIAETLGNQVQQLSAYDPLKGFMIARQSGSGASSTNLQDLEYDWDRNGNLEYRRDFLQSGKMETFTYDELNRLESTQIDGDPSSTEFMSYDVAGIGNILNKDNVGTSDYSYAETACSNYTHTMPHAVRSAGLVNYCYDENGNMTERGGNVISWTSYNKPSQINEGSNYSQFSYGADRSRWKQVSNSGSGGAVETTYYVGGLLEKITSDGVTEYRHRIVVGGDVSILHTRYSNSSANDTYYTTSDHLGSSSATTDQSGALVAHQSFDAFGLRRDEDWDGTPSVSDMGLISSVDSRGYTNHEMLDNVGLIHMNGRVYDPLIGRFISADPYVQAPDYSQSLNRYSYVWNNPLNAVDPSGFFQRFTSIFSSDYCNGRAECSDATQISLMNEVDSRNYLERREVSVGRVREDVGSTGAESCPDCPVVVVTGRRINGTTSIDALLLDSITQGLYSGTNGGSDNWIIKNRVEFNHLSPTGKYEWVYIGIYENEEFVPVFDYVDRLMDKKFNVLDPLIPGAKKGRLEKIKKNLGKSVGKYVGNQVGDVVVKTRLEIYRKLSEYNATRTIWDYNTRTGEVKGVGQSSITAWDFDDEFQHKGGDYRGGVRWFWE